MLPTPSKDARKPSGCTTYCSCEEPVLSVIDDAGLHDESATVVIIGGGPHALAALAALHEGSLAFQQYSDDSMFQARVGFNSHRKVGNGARRTHRGPVAIVLPPCSALCVSLSPRL